MQTGLLSSQVADTSGIIIYYENIKIHFPECRTAMSGDDARNPHPPSPHSHHLSVTRMRVSADSIIIITFGAIHFTMRAEWAKKRRKDRLEMGCNWQRLSSPPSVELRNCSGCGRHSEARTNVFIALETPRHRSGRQKSFHSNEQTL